MRGNRVCGVYCILVLLQPYLIVGHCAGLDTSSNYSLWSFMMETDVYVCYLTCLGVNGGFQGQKLVEEAKTLILPP